MNATALMIGGRTQTRPASRLEPAAPTRAPGGPQHMRALQRANEVRLARAELKRRVASGELSAAEVIRMPPDEALTMEVAELLMSQRRWGHTRARRFLAGIPMAETKPLGSMTPRQRDTLAHLLTVLTVRPGRTAERHVSHAV